MRFLPILVQELFFPGYLTDGSHLQETEAAQRNQSLMRLKTYLRTEGTKRSLLAAGVTSSGE